VTNILFDKLVYVDRLIGAGVPEDQARAHADAMDMALHEAVATKADIATLESITKMEIASVRADIAIAIAKLERDLTIRMGVGAVALFAALASIKYFG
jgi:hypothetical protein